MLSLAGGGSFIDNLCAINIVPVAISYEYDPNDYLKAREFLLRRLDPEFKKTQRDDLFAMETGLLQYKGRVHFAIGECINGKLSELSGVTDKFERVKRVCAVIDNAIHSNYRIYTINYIAYDLLNNTDRYAEFYTSSDVASFREYEIGRAHV